MTHSATEHQVAALREQIRRAGRVTLWLRLALGAALSWAATQGLFQLAMHCYRLRVEAGPGWFRMGGISSAQHYIPEFMLLLDLPIFVRIELACAVSLGAAVAYRRLRVRQIRHSLAAVPPQ